MGDLVRGFGSLVEGCGEVFRSLESGVWSLLSWVLGSAALVFFWVLAFDVSLGSKFSPDLYSEPFLWLSLYVRITNFRFRLFVLLWATGRYVYPQFWACLSLFYSFLSLFFSFYFYLIIDCMLY